MTGSVRSEAPRGSAPAEDLTLQGGWRRARSGLPSLGVYNCKQPRNGFEVQKICSSHLVHPKPSKLLQGAAVSRRSSVLKIIPGRDDSGTRGKMGDQRLCPVFLQ